MKKGLSLLLSLVVVFTVLTGCGSQSSATKNTDTTKSSAAKSTDSTQSSAASSKGEIVVGGKNFTEQFILSKMTSLYLKSKGYKVKEANNMGSSVVRAALKNGQVDMYWEYTGTGLVVYQKQPVQTDPKKAFEEVKKNDAKNNLIWLPMANFNNTYVLLMKKEESDKLGIHSISDLAAYINKNPKKLKLATNAEFYERKDGIKGLEKNYGFKFAIQNVVKMDSGLTYNALKQGKVDVGMGFATDGRIAGFNLVSLTDDKYFFPAYNAAPVFRKSIMDKYPELKGLMGNISSKLDTKTMRHLNYLVDVKHEDVAKVAGDFLKNAGLIK